MGLISRFLKKLEFSRKMNRLKANGLKVGTNYSIARNCIIDESHTWLIEIGNNVTITSGVTILSHDASMKKGTGYAKVGAVQIDDDVFIGVNSVILPGTRIGKKSIIGAGSVVSGEVPSGKVFCGVPAKEVATYEDFIKKHESKMKTTPRFSDEYTMRKNVSLAKKQEMSEKINGGIGYIE